MLAGRRGPIRSAPGNELVVVADLVEITEIEIS
jgi:hypothetical protein